MPRYNTWAWQIGAIFIALSFAAMGFQFQIEEPYVRLSYSIVLGLFSIGTIVIWDLWIIKRARFYIDLSYKRVRDVEYEIGQLCHEAPLAPLHHYKKPTYILHTFINEEDNEYPKWLKSIWGLVLFNVLIFFAWFYIWSFNHNLLLAMDP